jgi:phosphatidyl-myo-inositol dimannoside synthase
MRIAILHPFLFRYARGIERYVVSLSSELARNGVRVDVLTWTWRQEISFRDFSSDVNITKMPYLRYFEKTFAVLFYVFQLAFRRPDAVVVFFADYGESAALRLVRLLRPQPYCIVFHYPLEAAPYQYRQFARHQIAQRADYLVAVSEHVAADVRREFGRECAVVPGGVDLSFFKPDKAMRHTIRTGLGLGEDAPILITLAALEERKGIQWLIQSLPFLLQEFPGITYLVLGEGAYRNQLEALIDRLSLGGHVRLLGSTNNVVEYLAAADVGCLLSRGEAFGLSLLECMAMELPVVTSRNPPFNEFVRPEWGLLVDEHDPQSVALDIGTLLRDGEHRLRMGKAAREQAAGQYSWAATAEHYLSILTRPQ